MLDVRAVKPVAVGGKPYTVIGRDTQENALFVIPSDMGNSVSSPVFMIDSDLNCAENLEVNTQLESGYRSLLNFVCLMAFYHGEIRCRE